MPITSTAPNASLHASAAPRPALPPSVTARELTVLELVVEGLTNRQIADQLSNSPRTVQSHLGSLMRKLDAGTRTGLAVTALRVGLVPLEPFELPGAPPVPLAA